MASWQRPSATSARHSEHHRARERASPPGRTPAPVRRVFLGFELVMMATDESESLTLFDRNGLDEEWMRRVHRNPCRCKDVAATSCRAHTLDYGGAESFLERWYRLSPDCRGHLVATAYENGGPPGEMATTEWYFLGSRVCCSALGALLGTCPRTLYKSVHRVPDERRGTWSRRCPEGSQRRLVDQFFAELYISAAEHLPECEVHIGPVDGAIATDDATPWDALAPLPPPCDTMWSPDSGPTSQALLSASCDLSDIPPADSCNMHGCLTCGGNLWLGGLLTVGKVARAEATVLIACLTCWSRHGSRTTQRWLARPGFGPYASRAMSDQPWWPPA